MNCKRCDFVFIMGGNQNPCHKGTKKPSVNAEGLFKYYKKAFSRQVLPHHQRFQESHR